MLDGSMLTSDAALLALIVFVIWIVAMLFISDQGCTKDCNQGRNCDCGGLDSCESGLTEDDLRR